MAAHVVRAVAKAHGSRGDWKYSSRREFSSVMEHIALTMGNDRLLLLAGRAEALYANRYRRKWPLRRAIVEKDIVRMTELLGVLRSLADNSVSISKFTSCPSPLDRWDASQDAIE